MSDVSDKFMTDVVRYQFNLEVIRNDGTTFGVDFYLTEDELRARDKNLWEKYLRPVLTVIWNRTPEGKVDFDRLAKKAKEPQAHE